MQSPQGYSVFNLKTNVQPRWAPFSPGSNPGYYHPQQKFALNNFNQNASPSSRENVNWNPSSPFRYQAKRGIPYDGLNSSREFTDFNHPNQYAINSSVDSEKYNMILKLLERQQQTIEKMAQDLRDSSLQAEKINVAFNKKLKQLEETFQLREEKLLSKIKRLQQRPQRPDSGQDVSIYREERSVTDRAGRLPTFNATPSIELDMEPTKSRPRKNVQRPTRTERPRPTYAQLQTKAEI